MFTEVSVVCEVTDDGQRFDADLDYKIVTDDLSECITIVCDSQG